MNSIGAAQVKRGPSISFLLVSTILAVGFTMPAMAQSVPATPMPNIRESVDNNAVDLATGTLSLEVASVSIGTGDSTISFARDQRSNNVIDSSTAMIVLGSTTSPTTVTFGEIAFQFSYDGTVYTSAEGNGNTLTQSGGLYTFTGADGTIAVFDETKGTKTVNTNSAGQATTTYQEAKIVSYKSPNGEMKTYTYNNFQIASSSGSGGSTVVSQGRLQSITTNANYHLKLSYQSDVAANTLDVMKLTNVTTLNSNLDSCLPAAYTCTPSGPRPKLTIATSGATTTYTDAGNDVATVTSGTNSLSIQQPGYGAPNMVYTMATDRVTQAAVNGVNTNYSYADVGTERTTTRTTPAGSEIFKFYIPSLQLMSYRDGVGNTITYAYNAARQLTTVTYPEGNSVALTVDVRGNITQTTRNAKPGSGAAVITQTASYSATCTNFMICNKPIWTKDASGNHTDYVYAPTTGLVTSVTQPAATTGGIRPQTRYTYTALGGITKLTGVSACRSTASCAGTANETKVTVAYGTAASNNLNLQSITTGSGDGLLTSTSSFTYTPLGDISTVDGPLAGAADTGRAIYDLATRRIRGVVGADPDGAGIRTPVAQRYTYDAVGRVTYAAVGTVLTQSDADFANFTQAQATETVYDTNGRIVRQLLKSGFDTHSLTQISYDNAGRVSCTATRMDTYTFPAGPAGLSTTPLPATACDAGGGKFGPDRITQNTYDANSRIIKVQTALGTADQSDEVITTYSPNGLANSVTDGQLNKTINIYDGHDRLSQTRYPPPTQGALASSATGYEQLAYDANGNVTQLRLRDGKLINAAYDKLSRIALKDLPTPEIDVSYAYDLQGRTLSATQGSIVNAISYDALGRIVSEATAGNSTALQYDLAGRVTRITYPDGFYAGYVYNVGGLTAINENGATSGAGVLASYSYDNLGRRTSVTRGNGTVTNYSFDPVSRLLNLTQNLPGTAQDLTVGPFGYNPAGQIISAARSNDVYAWVGHYNVNRTYTANGLNQLTSAGTTALGYDGRGNLTSSGGSLYGYTAENRMITAPGGTAISYDPAGRIYSLTQRTAATRFEHLGPRMIIERNSSGAVLRRYVHGPGEDEPLVWYEGAGTTDKRWLHSDERGSVIAVTNGLGAAMAINSYDEYGIPAPSNLGRFGYTGQAWLAEIGMNYYKARMYSPTLGRFMQTDPIGYGDGINWYNYVGSDPVNKRDPSGLMEEEGPETVVQGFRPRVAAFFGGGNLASGGISYGNGTDFGSLFDMLDADDEEEADIVVMATRPRRGPSVGRGNPIPQEPQATDVCGSAGNSTLVPEGIGATSFQGACRRHERCYATPGNSQEQCDLQLGQDIARECRKTGGLFCHLGAYTFYYILSDDGYLSPGLGREAYENAQRNWR